MAVTLPDETRLKALLKDALVETLDEQRERLSALMVAALEDIALVQAIKEGESTDLVDRDEIFNLLGKKR